MSASSSSVAIDTLIIFRLITYDSTLLHPLHYWFYYYFIVFFQQQVDQPLDNKVSLRPISLFLELQQALKSFVIIWEHACQETV